MLDEEFEQVEHLRLDGDKAFAMPQLAPVCVQRPALELVAHRSPRAARSK
jgi:hypothetical protein